MTDELLGETDAEKERRYPLEGPNEPTDEAPAITRKIRFAEEGKTLDITDQLHHESMCNYLFPLSKPKLMAKR